MNLTTSPRSETARASRSHVDTATGKRRAGWLGIGWSSLAQLVGMVVRLGSNLILTRLLAPEAYGLFGTAMAIVTTLEWLSDLGVQPALIRHPSGDRRHYLLTGWWINLWRGSLLSAAMAVFAWPLALAYGRPSLAPVIAFLALKPVFSALKSPDMPLLRRNLNYRALFVDEVTQTLTATAVSLVLAYLTRSIWSIVAGTVAGACASTLVSYLIAPARPKLTWDRAAAREIAGFGRAVFLNTMVMAVWLNLDRLLGLRLVGDHDMGLYAVAWNLAAVAEALVTRACDVYFSMLSRGHEPEEQLAWHLRVSRLVAVRLMPAAAIGVMLGPFVIGLLYDERYSGARYLLGILVARLMIRGLGQVQFQYLLATARVGIGTKAYLAAMITQILALFPLIDAFGVIGMALSGLLSTTVLTAVQTRLLERRGVPSLGPFLITLAYMACGLLVLYCRR